jgi:nicotinic acid mononucleotide adenylyltransferase/nicotinamide mononucleotide (NMN) deamidase PncC
MLSTDIQQIIQQIHHDPRRLVLEFAGAGSMVLWWLHSVGGSSRTVLEATDRYSAPSLRELLGEQPENAVSVPTAQAMARQAYRRAVVLSNALVTPDQQAVPVLGVACTAAIATDYARRGEHRCIVAAQHAAGSTAYDLTLQKGLRDRRGEETIVSQLVLHAIARAWALDHSVPLDLAAGEAVQQHDHPASEPLARLLAGDAHTVTVYPDGRHTEGHPVQGAILSGSFCPLHEGHMRMAEAAADVLGMPAVFELPVINADKGTLIAEEVQRRLEQFARRAMVVLTRVPLFVEKAELFPGSVFVIGYDTAIRLVNPRYYGSEAAMHAALNRIRAAGCRFLVAGRMQDGRFHTLADVAVPPDLHDMFIALPEQRFRSDISSTELREHARQQQS